MVRMQVACEVGGGSLMMMALSLGCGAWPGLCGALDGSICFVVGYRAFFLCVCVTVCV